jgi:hypothetical protein
MLATVSGTLAIIDVHITSTNVSLCIPRGERRHLTDALALRHTGGRKWDPAKCSFLYDPRHAKFWRQPGLLRFLVGFRRMAACA